MATVLVYAIQLFLFALNQCKSNATKMQCQGSFNGKQLQEFTELTIKAVPNINKETIKSIFRSIKNGTNVSWNQYELAINALEKKLKLNIQIMIYKKIINNKKTNTLREVHSAKQHLIKLTMSTE
eukprot:51869_1